ncbi:MAG: DUF4238 domain-containing protein [Chloroflexi bacterium]|nr:DUF4238 domain-containing protein [Chloroflexota bacterium]
MSIGPGGDEGVSGAKRGADSSESHNEIDNTNKHYEPQSYLKRFGLDGRSDRIWVYDRTNPAGGPRLGHVKKVSVSRDAYTISDDKFLTERLEPGFKETLDFICPHVEAHGDFPIKIHPGLLSWMVKLLSVTQLRCSGRRSVSHPVIEGIYDEDIRATKVLFLEMEKRFPDFVKILDEALLKLGVTRQDLINAFGGVSGENNRREWVAKKLDPIGRSDYYARIRHTLEGGSWRFYKASEGRSYISSDIPAVQIQLGSEPEYKNSWVWLMPLSQKVCVAVLTGDAADPEAKYPPAGLCSTDEGVDLINNLVFGHAFRFVYSSDQSEIMRAAANDKESDWMQLDEGRRSSALSELREGYRARIEECLNILA